MKHSLFNPHSLIMLILLLTAAFVAGCGGGEPTEQVATTNDGNNRSTQSEDVVFMVRLLAKGDVRQYWFLDLASIRSDSGLAPLSQNLTDTWNGWNQDSSDEFGVTLQDADFAVSLPSNAVFLGGIEDIEGLRETVAALGYQQQEIAEVVYWINPDQGWESFTFLPNGVVMIMNRDPSYFLEGGVNNLIKYGSWDDDRDWQYYLDGIRIGRGDDASLDIGSIDDVVSDIRNSLMFHFDYNDDRQSMWSKAGADTLKETITGAFPDDEGAKLAETESKEGISKLRADAERAETAEQGEETAEERYMREYLAACTDQDADRSGNELTITQVCRTDWFDFRFANYLLSIQ